MGFQKAVRSQAYARIGICGPSGAGKTHSALKLAAGLAPGGRVFLLDTEQYSASLEAGKPDIPEFFVDSLEPPYSAQRYIEKMDQALREKPDVLIIDSISHAWASVGGILDSVEKARLASKSSKNAFAGWREATPQHNKFINAIMTANCHVICTMRSQTQHVIDEDDHGRKSVRKVGMRPIQRDGMEYEFTIVFDIERDGHIASASKDRTSLFDGEGGIVLSRHYGEVIRRWLIEEAAAPMPERPAVVANPIPAPRANGANPIVERLGQIATEHGFGSLKEALVAIGMGDVEPENLDVEKAVVVANKLKKLKTN